MPNWKKVVVSGSSAALSNLTVDNALTASGLIYPTTDGQDHEVLVTDGSGNLSFDRPNVYATVKNVSGVTLTKGTPVHANGTTGNASNVIAASSSVASTMPATYVLNEDLTNGAEGVAIVTGFINGVNTSAFSEGDIIYVGVDGGYTNVKPTTDSNLIQNLGIVNKVDATNGSGFIYGSGRSNDIPNLPEGKVWVGSSTYSVTSSVVHLDESNGRLGIGTVSPQAELHVEGDISGSGKLTISDHNYASNNNNRVRITPNYEKTTGIETGIYFYGNRTGSYSSNVSTYHFANDLRVATTGSAYTTSDHINFFNRLTTTEGSRYDDLYGFFNQVKLTGDSHTGDSTQVLRNDFLISGTGNITNDEVYANLSSVSINNANSTVGGIVGLYLGNTLTAGSASAYYGIDFQQSVNSNYHISGDYALLYSNETAVPTVGGSTYNIYLPAAMESYLGGDLNVGQAISASGAITGSDVKIDDWGSVSASLASINATGFVDGTGAANKVAFWTDTDTLSNDTNLHWDSTNDRLGIGVSNPQRTLQLGDGTTEEFVRSYYSDGSYAEMTGYGLWFNRNTSYLRPTQDLTKSLYIGHVNQAFQFVRLNTSEHTTFVSGSTETMRIHTGDGYVGIGTTSPQAKLHIQHTDASKDTLRLGRSDNSSYWIVNHAGNDFRLYNEDASGADILFGVDAGGTAENNKVGIGTASPNTKLEIVDSVTFTNVDTFGQFTIKSTAGTTGDMLNFGVDDTNNVSFIQSNNRGSSTLPLSLQRYGGNVGIGTTSPTEKLHISGSGMLLKSPSYTDSGFTITDDIYDYRFGTSPPTNNTNYFWVKRSSSSTYLQQSSGNWIFQTNSSELVRITSDGKVGIGVTSPSSTLHVSASTGFGIDTERGIQDGSRSGWAHYYSAGNTHILGRPIIAESSINFAPSSPDATTSTYHFSTNTSNVFEVAEVVAGVTVTSNILTISGSNVGIGTASPTQKLHVDGNIRVGDSTDTMYSNRFFGLSNASVYVQSNSGYPIILNAGASEQMRITSGGKVGIGTASPSYKLDISGDLRVLSSSISYQENIDVDSAAAETVATVVIADFDAAFFDYVIKSGTNLRAGTVTAVHDGTNVEYNEVSTQDLGDTSDVSLSVDISGTDMRLRATTTSDNWEIKSFVRTI